MEYEPETKDARRPKTQTADHIVRSRCLLYSPSPGVSQLYNQASDPQQLDNVMQKHSDVAKDTHQLLVKFMHETNVPDRLLQPRLELRL